jgi:translation initiation factor SUI1
MNNTEDFSELFNNFNGEDQLDEIDNRKIHIRYQQRNKRKGITIIEGLDESIDLKSFVKEIKKNFCCAGTIKEDEEDKKIILQFQGDHRKEIENILIDKYDCKNIIIHGG